MIFLEAETPGKISHWDVKALRHLRVKAKIMTTKSVVSQQNFISKALSQKRKVEGGGGGGVKYTFTECSLQDLFKN